eukprot:7571315-Pyramimonas_sp.AAC.1
MIKAYGVGAALAELSRLGSSPEEVVSNAAGPGALASAVRTLSECDRIEKLADKIAHAAKSFNEAMS